MPKKVYTVFILWFNIVQVVRYFWFIFKVIDICLSFFAATKAGTHIDGLNAKKLGTNRQVDRQNDMIPRAGRQFRWQLKI